MAKSRRDSVRTALDSKAWLRHEEKAGRRAVLPVIFLQLLQTACGAGQCWCLALCLAGVLRAEVPPLAIAAFAGLAVPRAAAGLVAERLAVNAGAAARRRLRSDALARLLAAGPVVLRGQHSGALMSMVVDQIEALDGFFARWIPAATVAIGGPLIVALAVLMADPMAAAVLAIAGLLVPAGMAIAGIGAATATRRQFAALSRLQARFLDRVRGIATIIAAGRGEDEAKALGRAADDLRRRTMRVLTVAFLSSAVLDCATAGAIVILALRAFGTSAALTAVPLFGLLAVPEFFAPLRAFSLAYQDRMQAQTAAEALATLPPAPAVAALKDVRTVVARGATIAFEDVRLVWDPARGPALDGLSFRVPAGETLILAGPSGAGKSSVIEILLGFVRPTAGRVTINGADIADLTAPALARLTGWVGQRPMLFAGTIAENIRFARPEASDEEVLHAAKAARVQSFAEDLPQGLDTPIGEGGFGLSGGQGQRIAVARAFLKNAPILLLDEPTAHLDPATESELLEGLRRLAIGRTVILASHSAIAHGLSGRRLDLLAGRAAPARGAA